MLKEELKALSLWVYRFKCPPMQIGIGGHRYLEKERTKR